MKNIVVFAGSNSKNSINKELAIYTSSLLENVEANGAHHDADKEPLIF